MQDSVSKKSQRLNVLMLTADRQIDRRILLEAESLDACGWCVTILGMSPDGATKTEHRMVRRLGSASSVAMRESFVLRIYRWVRRTLPMNSGLMRFMKRFVWRFFVDQETFYLRLFLGAARQFTIDVVVAHDLPMLPVAAQLAVERSARLVYDSHELYSEQEFSVWERRRWSAIESKYISRCDLIFTVNQSIATELKKRYGVDGIRVLQNAERLSSLPERPSPIFHQQFNLSRETRVLLMQGGISDGRNLENLVAAMGIVTTPKLALVFLGDGVLCSKLKALVRKSRLEHLVFFHGAVPQAELLSYTAAADMGVIPYQPTCLNNYYCTPNKMFEFIAAGVPIIATDLPEISRMVVSKGIGVVGDTETAEKIAKLIDQCFSGDQILEWKEQVRVVRDNVCWECEERNLINAFEKLK